MAKKSRRKIVRRNSAKVGKMKQEIEKKIAAKRQIIRIMKKPSPMELNVLWCLHLGTLTVGKISKTLNLKKVEVKDTLKNLEEKGLAKHRRILGEYKLTEEGIKEIGHQQIRLDAKITSEHITHGQETTMWILVKNYGNLPLNDASLKIVAPKFVEVKRYDSNYRTEDDRNVVEFKLPQLYPGETQSNAFKVKGFLTSGAVSSNYKIVVYALTGTNEVNKKELSLLVHS